jgi:hypothetical protein
MKRRVLISSIAVLGSLILFLSWVFQQTLLEDANSTLQDINAAESVYQTYQSNNALFNAILETTSTSEHVDETVRRYQIYDYELGLRDMEALLSKEARKDIPNASPSDAYDYSRDYDSLQAVTQERLGKIQEALLKKENEIVQRKQALNRTCLLIYAVGSLTVLVGSALSLRASSESN